MSFAKSVFVGLAAVSVGANVYQFLSNRGLKKILKDNHISGAQQCDVLRKAAEDLGEEYGALKKSIGDLVDEIAAGTVATDKVADRLMELYRNASKPVDKPAEAPKSDAQPEAPAPAPEKPADQK